MRFSALMNQACLLELADHVVQQVRGGRIRLVDLVVHVADCADRRLDRRGHEVHGVGGQHLALRRLGERGLLGDDRGSAIRGGVQGAHALGDGVRAVPGDVHHLVEVQVEVSEVGSHDVPVRLLAHQVEGDQVHEDAPQVLRERVRGEEAALGVLGAGAGGSCGGRNGDGLSHDVSPHYGSCG